ncbi:AAA family ATPase [Caenispirillum bisanense]|uniref:AAA family ATPase n=1 Tax=Caenispirillum bisanense TaxID=414052 RepID=UPI0031E32E90
MAQTVVIETVLHARWNGAIFSGRCPDGELRRFLANDLPRPPVAGEAWQISGIVRRHPKYGPQVHVETAALLRPSGRLIQGLLAGPRFPGIGAVTAHLLWEHHGETLYQVLDKGDLTAILAALGDSTRAREQAEVLVSVWPEIAAEPTVLAWLDRHGFPPRLAHKVIGCYGGEAIAKLVQDPYRLIAFAPWSAVDRAARSMGIGPADERRLVAACQAALYGRLDQSHTWTPDATFRRLLGRQLGRSTAINTAIDLAVEDGAIVGVDTGWQPLGPLAMECAVAERIAALVSGADAQASQPQLFHRRPADTLTEGWLDRWQGAHGMRLNQRQREAVGSALTCSFSLLLGGAGVGKTTVLRAICDFAHEVGVTVHLMALSGRAALRMTEATDRPARTIAGFLQRAEAGDLALDDEPLLVVDEASMVDLTSLYRILRACPPGCRFLLVGDPGQLPPVSFGITLHALADNDLVPKIELVEVMRQSAETGIPAAAAAVRAGQLPDLRAYDPADDIGVSFRACPRDEIVATVKEIAADLAGRSHQIIGSVKGTGVEADGGIRAINNALHAVYAHGRPLLPGDFAVGEPVIWTVNDYDLRIMNGSLGTVVRHAVDDGQEVLVVDFDGEQRHVPVSALGNLEHAWAITAHKAQGSQFDTVVIPVTRSRILDRTLLYTAITRAKRRVALVGDRTAFEAAVRQPPSSSRRQTGMPAALRRTAGSLSRPSNLPGVQ